MKGRLALILAILAIPLMALAEKNSTPKQSAPEPYVSAGGLLINEASFPFPAREKFGWILEPDTQPDKHQHGRIGSYFIVSYTAEKRSAILFLYPSDGGTLELAIGFTSREADDKNEFVSIYMNPKYASDPVVKDLREGFLKHAIDP